MMYLLNDVLPTFDEDFIGWVGLAISIFLYALSWFLVFLTFPFRIIFAILLDLLEVKLYHGRGGIFSLIGIYVSFTITLASYTVASTQTSVATALTCLVAFDFLKDIFKKEMESM